MPRILYILPAGALCLALAVPFGTPRPASAHEHRMIGQVEMTVGWADEPTFAGFKNGVQLILHDKAGKPFADLGDTLKVEVSFGTQKTGPLPLERAFGKTFGRPGDYRAAIIPTRPGNYTFHFVGTIGEQKVDESFTSSEKTFDPVADSTEIEFPVKDPSAGELAARVERVGPRVEAAQSAARDAGAAGAQARTLAIVGIVLGAIGAASGLASRRKR